MGNVIDIQHLSKSFGSHEVLKDINFSVEKGEVVTVIGSSGSGKSTLLRCINLLEIPSGGEIIYHGENILQKKNLNDYRKHMGMVFQQFNLFNNWDVLNNCTVGQKKILKRSKAEAEEIALNYLKVVGMDRYVKARPHQLSGGQKQRVAIARALVLNPKVLLCDEPTSALDPQTTENILDFLKSINEQLGVTLVVVTHEMDVVNTLCHRVAVMEEGRVQEELVLSQAPTSATTRIGHLLVENRRKESAQALKGEVVHV